MSLCGTCNKQIPTTNKSIQCFTCHNLFHVSGRCSDMNMREYNQLYAEKKIKGWKCRSCINDTEEDLSKSDTRTKMNFSEEEQMDDGTLSLSQRDLTAIGGILKKLLQAELSPTFRQDFNDLRTSVEFISNEFEDLKREMAGYRKEVDGLKMEISTLKSENIKLREEVTHIKSHSVANNIVITGLPETPNEAVTEIFNSISKKIKSESTHKNLSDIHRIPARNGIKPLIVKFVSKLEKEAWLVNFQGTSRMDTEGPGLSTFSVCKNLPAGRIQAHHYLFPAQMTLLRDTRKAATEKGYKFTWIRDGKILVRKDENSRAVMVIKSESDLTKL